MPDAIAAEPWWQPPRRDRERRALTGTAAGTARELGVDPLVIRVALIVLTIAGGWGIVLYAGLWVWARSAGDRPFTDRPKGRSERHRLAAVGLLTLGLLLFIRSLGLGFVDTIVWPAAVLAVGFLEVWGRSKDDDLSLMSRVAGGKHDRLLGLRVLAGVAIASGGVAALLALNLDLGAARDATLAGIVVLGGLLLLFGPWILRIFNDLGAERRRRIRSEERSEVAAHLHDSVLQTLALIQQNSDDQQTMVRLARQQERELREWLYGGGGPNDASLHRALLDIAAEVEELHTTPVEVVVVGDLDVAPSESEVTLLAAMREAVVNAAKHSGAEKVDVFAEARGDTLEVFVRDTGCGFDVDQVPGDRLGLRDSIRARMRRAGGEATIHTELGGGTEVELVLPRGDLRRDHEPREDDNEQ